MKKHPEDAPFRQSPEDNCRFTFIDLFAGIGGIRLPFQQQGGRCVFTSEWDKFAQRTYFANFGEMPDGDITRIAAKDIPDHDILLGGFPCQAFSQAGARQGFNDTRGTMFFEVQRIMTEKRPKAFLLENVKQLRGHDGGRTLQTILDILRGQYEQTVPDNIPLSEETRSALSQKLNYWVDFRVLRAADFGIPQNRERIFIIGFDRDQFPDADFDTLFSWPEPTHQLPVSVIFSRAKKRWRKMRCAIKKIVLPSPINYGPAIRNAKENIKPEVTASDIACLIKTANIPIP
ncbi:DNA-cytosine methyltransferase [Morganella morganii IS15]|nr:DNA (cytosine-5-)-methyltransferase [Morganella morganii]CDK63496.1 DNA-cytosine methyltransferase [Morganella morganii IS15]